MKSLIHSSECVCIKRISLALYSQFIPVKWFVLNLVNWTK